MIPLLIRRVGFSLLEVAGVVVLTFVIARVVPGDPAVGWAGPYLKNASGVPLDPWNHPYLYRSPSSRDGHDFDLCSQGANEKTASAGSNGQICNQ